MLNNETLPYPTDIHIQKISHFVPPFALHQSIWINESHANMNNPNGGLIVDDAWTEIT